MVLWVGGCGGGTRTCHKFLKNFSAMCDDFERFKKKIDGPNKVTKLKRVHAIVSGRMKGKN